MKILLSELTAADDDDVAARMRERWVRSYLHDRTRCCWLSAARPLCRGGTKNVDSCSLL